MVGDSVNVRDVYHLILELGYMEKADASGAVTFSLHDIQNLSLTYTMTSRDR